MKSHFLEKIPNCFLDSAIPYTPPGEDEAVIIIADLSDIKALELPLEESDRAGKITHLNSRRRYLAGRYLVRSLLSRWYTAKPKEIPITLSPGGKPFAENKIMPRFSISHSAGTIAVIFSFLEVGIDLEAERPVNILALARRFFSREEAEFLETSQSLDDFFRLWSCREAAIKADGRGLGALLDVTKVGCGGNEDSTEGILVTIEDVNWCAMHWKLRCGTHGAVAFRQPPGVIRWCDLR